MTKRESRNLIIATLLVAVIAVAGSFIYSNVAFKGTGKAGYTGAEWKIDITDISVCTLNDQLLNNKCQSAVGDASNVKERTYISEKNSLRATFTAELYGKEDAITYKVTLKNSGKLRTRLTGIRFDKVESSPVIFTYNNLVESEIIEPGTTKEFYVMVSNVSGQELDENMFTNALELTFKIEK